MPRPLNHQHLLRLPCLLVKFPGLAGLNDVILGAMDDEEGPGGDAVDEIYRPHPGEPFDPFIDGGWEILVPDYSNLAEMLQQRFSPPGMVKGAKPGRAGAGDEGGNPLVLCRHIDGDDGTTAKTHEADLPPAHRLHMVKVIEDGLQVPGPAHDIEVSPAFARTPEVEDEGQKAGRGEPLGQGRITGIAGVPYSPGNAMANTKGGMGSLSLRDI